MFNHLRLLISSADIQMLNKRMRGARCISTEVATDQKASCKESEWKRI